MKKGVARGLTSLAKISLAAGIIALLLWKKVDLRELAVLLRGLDLRAFAACWFGYGLLFILSARRWKALVEVQGIRARYGALLGFCLIGAFFNNIMPGSMGGDILKAWYCARVDHSRKAGAVSSVLADRIVGFLSLFAIGFLGLVVNAGAPGLRQASVLFLALFSAICAALALLYSRTLLARVPFAKALLDRMPFRENIRRLYDSLYVYRSHPRVLAKALAISCVMQLIFILIMLGTARALGITGVTYLHLLLLTPLIGTIAAIPLTPSGWGTMEGAFCYFFPAIGVGAEQALALDLVTRVLVISWSLVGGVVYALPRFRGLSE